MVPNTFLQVYLRGTQPRFADDDATIKKLTIDSNDNNGKSSNNNNNNGTVIPPRPAFATANLTINVSREDFELDLEILPSKQRCAPGEKMSVEVTVKDCYGEPGNDINPNLTLLSFEY